MSCFGGIERGVRPSKELASSLAGHNIAPDVRVCVCLLVLICAPHVLSSPLPEAFLLCVNAIRIVPLAPPIRGYTNHNTHGITLALVLPVALTNVFQTLGGTAVAPTPTKQSDRHQESNLLPHAPPVFMVTLPMSCCLCLCLCHSARFLFFLILHAQMKLTEAPPSITRSEVRKLVENRCSDIERARKDLGYEPR